MSRNLGYTRKFIILRKDYSNMVDLSPKGHGKIEVKGLKGNISISLENAEKNQWYNILLVDGKGSYDLGKIYTEDNGKGREDIVFNIQDLESKGFSVDKINGVLIRRGSYVLLGGYMDKEDGSLERFISKIAIKEEPIQKEVIQKEPILEEEPIQKEIMQKEPILEEPEFIETKVDEPVIKEYEPEVVVKEEIIQEVTSLIAEDNEEVSEVGYTFDEVNIEEIVIDQVIEPLVGDDFQPIFEPILELSQEPEVLAEEIEVDEPEADEIEVKELKVEELVEEEVQEVVGDAVAEDIYIDEVCVEEVEDGLLDLASEGDSIIESLPEVELEEIVDEEKEFDYEHNRRINQRNQTTNYVLNILRYFPYIDPFRLNLAGYNWWKIDFQDETKGFLPYFSYLIGGDQKYRKMDNTITARDLMGLYSHYLFGLYNVGGEVKYYVYAVPGGFYKDEHPHNGITGFNTWFAGQEIGGYWLLYIDSLTGKVIYPVNPMIPTD